MIKRRNIDSAKMRKAMKKGKISEGFCTGSLVYMKLLVAWAVLMLLDCVLGLRFEYLWPFWLLIRSIYDSFRYQGMAFSVFFVCITVTSDLVCFLFIPVQWLFFLASTYVWVQYVWHTDRGICLPTVSLWLLFIYVETSVRLKELNSRGPVPFPFTLDLCRPFAAHCIGYPVVTLGFGVKSYVGYKFRLRKQREVARENEFYAQLLAQALPGLPEEHAICGDEESVSLSLGMNVVNANGCATFVQHPTQTSNYKWFTALKTRIFGCGKVSNGGISSGASVDNLNVHNHESDDEDRDSSRSSLAAESSSTCVKRRNGKGASRRRQTTKDNNNSIAPVNLDYSTQLNNTKDETEIDYEKERLQREIRSARILESDLRNQIASLQLIDKNTKGDLQYAKHRTEQLESKYQNVVRSREQEKQTIVILEKKLVEEQRLKSQIDKELEKERKKKSDEIASAKAMQLKGDDLEQSRQKRRELETETRGLKREIRLRDDSIAMIDAELQALRLYKINNNSQSLLAALNFEKERATQLEHSLSAENKLKQDLFSALGEAKRQLEIAHAELAAKNRELLMVRNLGVVNEQLGESGTSNESQPIENEQHNNFDILQSAIYSFHNSYLNNGPLIQPSYGGGNSGFGESTSDVTHNYLNTNGRLSTSFTPPRSN